ncbi:MAG: pyridoxine 5'-phosphate synthase [Pseudomonas sp.]
MIKLSVNLNKIALIRNSRPGTYPSVTEHARICLAAGADGITVHPRPDQRHIRPDDVRDLAALLRRDYAGIEFNVEGNPFAPAQGSYPGFMSLVEETQPQQCTLVPDSDEQLTSDHGFDLTTSAARLEPVIRRLRDQGMRVSLFMDPDLEQIRLAKEVGADRIELYTGPYAEAWGDPARLAPLHDRYAAAAALANDIGLGVNAGHDLNLDNLVRFREMPGLLEVSIGHAFTVDAIAMGMAAATRAYKAVLGGA